MQGHTNNSIIDAVSKSHALTRSCNCAYPHFKRIILLFSVTLTINALL